MKLPNNAGSFAGVMARIPRAAIAALTLVLVLALGFKVLVPLFSDDTNGGTTVSPAFQKFSDDLAHQISLAFDPYQQALNKLAGELSVIDALRNGSNETRAALAANSSRHSMVCWHCVCCRRITVSRYRRPNHR